MWNTTIPPSSLPFCPLRTTAESLDSDSCPTGLWHSYRFRTVDAQSFGPYHMTALSNCLRQMMQPSPLRWPQRLITGWGILKPLGPAQVFPYIDDTPKHTSQIGWRSSETPRIPYTPWQDWAPIKDLLMPLHWLRWCLTPCPRIVISHADQCSGVMSDGGAARTR